MIFYSMDDPEQKLMLNRNIKASSLVEKTDITTVAKDEVGQDEILP